MRRIEALTGEAALAQALQTGQRLSEVAGALKTAPGGVTDKVSALRSDYRDLEKELARLKQKLATSSGGDLTQSAVEVAGIKVLACQIEGADAGTLRDTLDQCKNKLGSAVVLLAAVEDDKIRLVAGVTQDVTDRVRAGDVIKEFAGRLGGKGGGRPDMAQGVVQISLVCRQPSPRCPIGWPPRSADARARWSDPPYGRGCSVVCSAPNFMTGTGCHGPPCAKIWRHLRGLPRTD